MPVARDFKPQIDKELCLQLLGVTKSRKPIPFAFLSDVLDFPVRFPWSTQEDSRGRIYFINCENRRTCWEHPFSNTLRGLLLISVDIEPSEDFRTFVQAELDRFDSAGRSADVLQPEERMKRFGLELLLSPEYISSLIEKPSASASNMDTEESFFMQTFSAVDLAGINVTASPAQKDSSDSSTSTLPKDTHEIAASTEAPTLSLTLCPVAAILPPDEGELVTQRQILRNQHRLLTTARVLHKPALLRTDLVKDSLLPPSRREESCLPEDRLDDLFQSQIVEADVSRYLEPVLDMEAQLPQLSSERVDVVSAAPDSLFSSPHHREYVQLAPLSTILKTSQLSVYGRFVRKPVVRTNNYLKLRQVDIFRRALSR